MKGRPVDQLVYEYMFKNPKTSDPQNFHAILTRYLIYEVRQEVHSFYGHLDTPEAKYPGLDYNHPIHQIRLSRWQWHRRLFRAFKGLALTPAEIAGLTKWEGTKWAKERYEKEQGKAIEDTAAAGILPWVEPENRTPLVAEFQHEEIEETEEVEGDENMEGEDESEDELNSIGVQLNERIMRNVAARNAGDSSQPVDEVFEQWLKNALETGEFSLITEQLGRQTSPEEIFPPRMVNAAREGNWHQVPEQLREILQHSFEIEESQQQARSTMMATEIITLARQVPGRPTPANVDPWPTSGTVVNPETWVPPRRTYSALRVPVGGGSVAGSDSLNHTRG